MTLLILWLTTSFPIAVLAGRYIKARQHPLHSSTESDFIGQLHGWRF